MTAVPRITQQARTAHPDQEITRTPATIITTAAQHQPPATKPTPPTVPEGVHKSTHSNISPKLYLVPPPFNEWQNAKDQNKTNLTKLQGQRKQNIINKNKHGTDKHGKPINVMNRAAKHKLK